MSRQKLCAMWARGHCTRGRCQDRHYKLEPNEQIPCDCPERSDAFPGGARFRHVERLADCAAAGKSLLGDAQSFCAAFYHVKETPEAGGAAESCLRSAAAGERRCSGKTVVCVARLSAPVGTAEAGAGDLEDVYVARYINCCSGALCAESSFLEDGELRLAVSERGGAGSRLILYLNTQPCHFSTDTRPNWSCSESLCRFQQECLEPRSMKLQIIAAYPYRCHWDPKSVPGRLAPKIENARKGSEFMRKASPHVELRAFQPKDWEYLLQMCDARLREDHAKPEHEARIFTKQRREARVH
eukprot:CAMPEP_0206245732 /NCGR_PEP_ID=MMETSP0047_2-20121206/18859_1 /ASSEMBLY_ACC=CAM_ASM_000192 /TAXON_ID=195065 /ORGANISM="Chroomonas mesostigmatica_cf, Strain CCMP1168" /LENGTH=298 /DNA_ID=CAMNT_0053671061 /DNA_START=346 /DNA_END=1239 /DNA_ORIENTATION=+